jgi:hypothetical protein
MKKDIDDLGGLDEVRNLSATHKALVDEQEDLDNKARAGDPEILNNLIEIAGNEGFVKLMPVALSRWANSDNPGYSHEMSKIMVNALRDGGVVGDLNLAFKMLKLGTPEAIKEASECLNRAAEWANGINKIAVTAPARPQVNPQIAQEQKKIDDQKAQLFNQEFSGTFGRWRQSEIDREVGQASGGKALSDYQMSTLRQRVVDDIKEILMADKEYLKNLQRVYDTRDMADLLKFSKSRTSKVLPDVVKKAYRSLFGSPGVKKPVAKSGVTTVKSGAAATPVVKGWIRVDAAKAPKPEEIDGKKTDFEMKFRKQAILKNGEKVYWGTQVPK